MKAALSATLTRETEMNAALSEARTCEAHTGASLSAHTQQQGQVMRDADEQARVHSERLVREELSLTINHLKSHDSSEQLEATAMEARVAVKHLQCLMASLQ